MRNTHQRFQFKATVIAVAMAVLPLATHAAGLGRITVLSALGQPLKAELEVTATSDESPSLAAKVASVDAFQQAGIDYSPALATLRFSRDIKVRGGRQYLEISTDQPLNEPFIDMLVEMSWASGRLVREYTFLLDPPDLTQRTAPEPVAAPAVKAEPAMAKPSEPAAALETTQAKPVPPVAEPTPAQMRPVEKLETKTGSRSASGKLRTVVAGDTLGKIAAQTMPKGVSLDQMLVALFRSNREVFDGGNMNRVQAGKILSIPDAEDVEKVSPVEARQEVVAQAVDFAAYRKRLAAAAAAGPVSDQASKQAASGKIAPRVADEAPLATGKDKLQVSRTEATKDAKGKPLQGRISALEEDLVARDRALKEASSRIADLEKNLSDLQKLAQLKSGTGASLQKPAPATPAAAASPPAPAESAPAKPQEMAKPEEAPKLVEAPKPPPPKKKKPAPPPPPPPEPDFIEENAPLVFGGGALLALLFGWLGYSTYRKKRAAAADDDAIVAETDLSAHSVFSSTSVAPPPGEQEDSQFSSTGIGMAATQETVDPVVEADTFLAFGRDSQAEEILLDALETDPQRAAIHLKLLDIYSARKNAQLFESVAKELHTLTSGTGADWEKAALMGAALDPDNPLYQSAPTEASAGASVEAPANEVDPDATVILRSSPVSEAATTEVAEEVVDTASALDFDLDIGTADSASAESVSVEAEAESSGLDFDLDLGAPDSTPSPDAAQTSDAGTEAGGLDIDFDMPASESTAEAIPDAPAPETPPVVTQEAAGELKVPAAATDSSSIDFEFDMGTPEAAAPETSGEVSLELPASTESPTQAPALDLGDISLELDTPPASTGEKPIPAAVPAGDDSSDNPEVATKLELAMAYEEMGDHDGARELFQEALAEGSPAQQKVARAKLDSIG
ncbi:MAG: pilus assembly protein [Sulfuritalea sp.]|nr:pilus assembly protein [Sulfuritalea sp.]